MFKLKLSPPAQNRRGFTIVEIIMVFIIIGILTSILVPVIANRAEEARISATRSDLERIADAQERAGVDTGYFYRLYALNDTGDPSLPSGNPNARANLTTPFPDPPAVQSLFGNRVTTNNYYENPVRIFINASQRSSGRGDLESQTNADALMARAFANETAFNFNGPYLNWHMDTNQNDWPEDAWGNDYILFTRAGAMLPPLRGQNGQPDRPDTSAQFQRTLGSPRYTLTYNDLQEYFDRPTLVSLGPNGVPGDGTDPNTQVNGDFPGRFGRGDDLIRQFGSP